MNHKIEHNKEAQLMNWEINSANKDFGKFVYRMWYCRTPNTLRNDGLQYHFEILKEKDGHLRDANYDYYNYHTIDQLKENNLTNKALLMILKIKSVN